MCLNFFTLFDWNYFKKCISIKINLWSCHQSNKSSFVEWTPWINARFLVFLFKVVQTQGKKAHQEYGYDMNQHYMNVSNIILFSHYYFTVHLFWILTENRDPWSIVILMFSFPTMEMYRNGKDSLILCPEIPPIRNSLVRMIVPQPITMNSKYILILLIKFTYCF